MGRRSAGNLSGRETSGVLAQLVERLNGIEEVRGSNPLGSTIRGVYRVYRGLHQSWVYTKGVYTKVWGQIWS